jgi:uncharacterized membrane protein
MEYLTVQYPRKRNVLIKGQVVGATNEVIELEGGSYTVELSPPANYTPSSRKVDLADTSALDPKVITFEPVK